MKVIKLFRNTRIIIYEIILYTKAYLIGNLIVKKRYLFFLVIFWEYFNIQYKMEGIWIKLAKLWGIMLFERRAKDLNSWLRLSKKLNLSRSGVAAERYIFLLWELESAFFAFDSGSHSGNFRSRVFWKF